MNQQKSIQTKSNNKKQINGKRQKSISALKSINIPMLKINNDSEAIQKIKKMTENHLTKKELLLKLEEIKQLKEGGYNKVSKIPTFNHAQLPLHQQTKRTIYSNFQSKRQQSVQKQILIQKDSQQNSQYQIFHRRHPSMRMGSQILKEQQRNHQINNEKYFSQNSKKVVSIGGGFKKRSMKMEQFLQRQQMRNKLAEIKIARSTSMKFFKRYNVPEQPTQRKLTSFKLLPQLKHHEILNDIAKIQSNDESQRSPSRNTTSKYKSVTSSLKYRSNPNSQKQPIQQQRQINLPVSTQPTQITRITDYPKLIQSIKQKRKPYKNQQFHQIKQFFEQNGFGINTILEEFDVLSRQDSEGKVFNLVFRDEIVECPYYTKEKQYKRIDLRIVDNDQKQKSIIGQVVNCQQMNNTTSTKPTIQLKNRMSIKIKPQTKPHFLTKISNLIQSQVLTSQTQIKQSFQYINSNYWQRILQAKSKYQNYKNYHKYLRYIEKQQKKYSFEVEFGHKANYKGLIKNNQDYKPSVELNFQKRTNLEQAIEILVKKQCYQIYSKHYEIVWQNFINPKKYEEIRLRIQQSPYVYRPQVLKIVSNTDQFQYGYVKTIIQQQLHCKIINFNYALDSIAKKLLSQQEKRLNIELIVKNINENKFNTIEKILSFAQKIQQQSSNNSISTNILPMVKIPKYKKGIQLKVFTQKLGQRFNVLIKQILRARQIIITQILYFLQQSFHIPSTNKNKKWLQSIQNYKKYLQCKYFTLLNHVFVQKVNQVFYDEVIGEIIKWLDSKNNIEVFALKVRINQKFFGDKYGKEKELVYEPQKVVFEESMKELVYNYLVSIEAIKDLVEQLLPLNKNSANTIVIFNPKKQLIQQTILQFTQQNYSIIFNKLTQQIHPLLKYFHTYHFNPQIFAIPSLQIYQQLLQNIKSDKKKLTYFYITQPTAFIINLSELKSQLNKQIQKRKQKIFKKIQKQLKQQIQLQYKLFQQMNKKLSFRPITQEEYVQMKSFVLVQCQKFVINATQHFQICQQYFIFFEKYTYEYPFQVWISSNRIIIQMNKFRTNMQKKIVELEAIFLELLEKINEDREKISRCIDVSKFKIQEIATFSVLEEYNRYYVESNKCYYELKANQVLLQNINKRQGILKQQLSIFPALKSLHRQLQPYYQLYTGIYQIKNFDMQWKDKPLMNLNYFQLKQKLDRNLNIFQKMGKILVNRRNADALAICQAGKVIIKKNQQLLWIVQCLTKQAMIKKPNLLHQALNCIFQGLQYNIKQINIQLILKQNLTQQKKSFVIQKALLAQKIYNLEKNLQSVVSNCKKLYFQFKKYKKLEYLPYIDNIYLKYLISSIKEQRQSIQIIEGNEVAHLIHKKINYVLNKIVVIQMTLDTMYSMQQIMFKILKTFKIKQIQVEFTSQENKKVKDIQTLWKTIIQTFNKDLQLWECIDSDSYRNKLLAGYHFFETVYAKIQKIVQQKMKVFPRLYFISKTNLITLLQQQENNVQLSQQHLNLIFGSSFTKFIFTQDQQPKKIIGIQGQFGEVYKFKNIISTKLVFWNKYYMVEEEKRKTMKNVIYNSQMKNENSKKYFILEILEYYQDWTRKVEEWVMKGNDKSGSQLKQEQNEIACNGQAQQIKRLIQSSSLTTTFKTHFKKSLIMIQNLIYLRNLKSSLLKSANPNHRLQQWKLLPKYKPKLINKQNQLCLCTTNNALYGQIKSLKKEQYETGSEEFYIPYGYELPTYEAFPLHEFDYSYSLKHQFAKLICLKQYEFKCPVVEKRYLEMFSNIGNHTMNHYVHVEVNQGSSRNVLEQLKNVFKGFLLSECFGSISIQNITKSSNQDILSYFAFNLQQIYHELQQKSYSFQFQQTTIKLGRNYTLNFCLTLQTLQQFSCTNYSEKRLLETRIRQLSLCQPDQKQLCLFLVQSFVIILLENKLVEEEQKDGFLEVLKQIGRQMLQLLRQLEYKRKKILNFIQTAIQSILSNLIQKSLRKQGQKIQFNKIQLPSVFLQQLFKTLVIQNTYKKIQSILLNQTEKYNHIKQFFLQRFNLQNVQINELNKKCKQIQNAILLLELKSIVEFKYVHQQEEQQQDQNSLAISSVQNEPQLKQQQQQFLTQENINKFKEKYIRDKFNNNLIHPMDVSSSQTFMSKLITQLKYTKNKILILGQKRVSMKTSTINQIIQNINLFNLSFFSFYNYFISQFNKIREINNEDNPSLKEKANNQIMNLIINQAITKLSNISDIICNHQRNQTLPTPTCKHSLFSSTECQKWHLCQENFLKLDQSILKNNKKLIIQSSDSYQLNQWLTPNILTEFTIINLPSQNFSFQQIVSYQFTILVKKYSDPSSSNILKISQQIITKIVKDQVFLQNVNKTNFITLIHNYVSYIQIFYPQMIDNSYKQNDLNQFLLMILSYTLFPYFNIGQSNLKPQDFNSTFQLPLNQIFNWFYSVQKHSWIQWVTFTQFIYSTKAQSQSLSPISSLSSRIYIPTNESVLFTYYIQKSSKITNILILTQQPNTGTSFLIKQALRHQNTIRYNYYGKFLYKNFRTIFEKQTNKCLPDGVYVPSKNREIKCVIENVNMEWGLAGEKVDNKGNGSQQQWLYFNSLFNYSYDLQRKSYFQKVKFVVSTQNRIISNPQLNKSKPTQVPSHNLFKTFQLIKLKKYSQQSCKHIFKTILQDLFGNTQNPYSKDIRQTTQFLIYFLMQLKTKFNIISNQRQNTIGFYNKILLSLYSSTPKVIKQVEHILGILVYQFKRYVVDSIRLVKDTREYRGLVERYNAVIRGIQQKMESNNQTQTFQLNKIQLGLQIIPNQKLPKIKSILQQSKLQLTQISQKNQSFSSKEIIFCKLPSKQNSVAYKQQYRYYENISYLQTIIQKEINQKLYEGFRFPFSITREYLSDIVKIMRIFTMKNNHAFLTGISVKKIKKIVQIGILLSENNINAPQFIQLNSFNDVSIRVSLLKILKTHFKKYKKTKQLHTIPIVIQIPTNLTIQNKRDLHLLCQYLQTNQFISWITQTKQSPYKLNFLKQLKIKSVKSSAYQEFRQFCMQSFQFIFITESKLLNITKIKQIFDLFPSLYLKTSIKMNIGQMNNFNKIQLTQKYTKKFITYESNNLLAYNLCKFYYEYLSKKCDPLKQKTILENQCNYKFIRFNELLYVQIQENYQKIDEAILIRNQAIGKINQIFQFKKYLQRNLQRLVIKQASMVEEHKIKEKHREALLDIQREKYQIMNDQEESCKNQQKRCKQLQCIVDEQMSKVGPILAKAQQVLQKVTRDDINQLRSFPNPPLPAAKVCQSLIFVFNQVHLIKQKVLDTGQKVKDFWQYAKKMILNDKLLKRISDFNPQTIKNIEKNVIQSVRQITKKPQFIEQRVFKASGAAGNLSLWIKAVVQVYDVMQVIQPKKKQLRQAQLLLSNMNDVLAQKNKDLQIASQNVNNQNLLIQTSWNQLTQIRKQIATIKQQIKNIDKLLVYLQASKKQWTSEIIYLAQDYKTEVTYYSIWTIFTKTLLSNQTEHRIQQFLQLLVPKNMTESQLDKISSQSGLDKQFLKFIKKYYLPDVQSQKINICNGTQINSIIILSEFQNKIMLMRQFIKNKMPFCFGQFYFNKLFAFFDHIKSYDLEMIKSYWIVDETTSLKYLLKRMKQSKQKDQFRQFFKIKVVQVIDCLQYKSFQQFRHSYLKKQGKENQLNNNQGSQSQQEEQGQNQLNQHQSQNNLLNQKQSIKKVVLIQNLQHCLQNYQCSLNHFIQLFIKEKILPIFITEFKNNQLEQFFRDNCQKIMIDLSLRNFKCLLRNGVQFLKLDKSKYYKTCQQIYTIKLRSDKVLKQLTFNKKYNQNTKFAKIQLLLQDNSQVIRLIQQFINIQKDKIRLQQINKTMFNKKSYNQNLTQLQNLLNNLYKGIDHQQIPKKTITSNKPDAHFQPLMTWKNHITFSDLFHKYLIQQFVVQTVLKQLKHQSENKIPIQISQIIQTYLNNQKDEQKYLHKFIEKMNQEMKRFWIGENQKTKEIQFNQVVNCFILQTPPKLLQSQSIQQFQQTSPPFHPTNLISLLKQNYQQYLKILQPQPSPSHQTSLPLGQLQIYYTKGLKLVIFCKNIWEANKLAKTILQQIRNRIYNKCINQKQMDQRELKRYLEEQENFKVFLLVEQQVYDSYIGKENGQVVKQKLIRPWNQQMVDMHFKFMEQDKIEQQQQEQQSVSENKQNQNSQIQQINQTNQQNSYQKPQCSIKPQQKNPLQQQLPVQTPSKKYIQNIFKWFQTIDQDKNIIQKHIKLYINFI